MKRLFTAILSIALCQAAFAQKTDTALFNGVTKIIVSNDKSAEDNYKLAGTLMLDQGYNIGSKDAEFFQISSEPVKVFGQGVTHMMSIYAVAKDHQITITSKSKSLTTTRVVSWQDKQPGIETVPYKKTRILAKSIYSKLQAFAKSLGGKVTYSE